MEISNEVWLAIIAAVVTLGTGFLGLAKLLLNILTKQSALETGEVERQAKRAQRHAGHAEDNARLVDLVAKQVELTARQHEMLCWLVEIHKDQDSVFATRKMFEKLTEMDKYLSQTANEIDDIKEVVVKALDAVNESKSNIDKIPEQVVDKMTLINLKAQVSGQQTPIPSPRG